MKSKTILVTGGAGYIGSHMVRMLLEQKLKPVVFDDLSTGHREFIPPGVPLVIGDLKNINVIRKLFRKYHFDAVMHFAASVVVPESVKNPIKYYENNTFASLNLIKIMLERKVNKIIFSSTAAVYGDAEKIPVSENAPTIPTNPYGMSKLMTEEILKDVSNISSLRYVTLRYFNVAGSHPSGEIGIRHKKVTHLVPCILKAASGRAREFIIFGDDYPTKDGTCIRDFIYVMDLCRSHLLALNALDKGMKSNIFNLGNGDGFSVKEVLDIAKEVTGKRIKTRIGSRRPGDPSKIVASSRKAGRILKWKPIAKLEKIVQTAWNWELLEQKRMKNTNCHSCLPDRQEYQH